MTDYGAKQIAQALLEIAQAIRGLTEEIKSQRP